MSMGFGTRWGRKINDLLKDGKSSAAGMDITYLNVIFPRGKRTPLPCLPILQNK